MPESSAWNDINVPRADFNVRQVAGHMAVPCYWGRDTQGACLFILELEGDHTAQYRKNITTVNGIDVDLRAGGAGAQRLVLALDQQVDRDLFEGLCRTLVSALAHASDSASSLAVALAHIRRWKAFLSGRGAHHLSPEKVRGLFAELAFLVELLDRWPSTENAVAAWLGPEKSHQDFIFGNTAVEIKSLFGTERSTVHISSEDQLESLNDALFLRIYRLSSLPESPNAQSLNEIVTQVQGRLAEAAAIEEFYRKLVAHGYAPLPDYDEPRLVVSEVRNFGVAKGFPKLIRSALPEGVSKVSYDIRLEAIASFECDGETVFGGELMEQTVEEFFHDFRQEMLAGAEANSTYQLESFMDAVSNELIETGFVEGFEHCHYRAPRGMRVDGYWFNDEGALDIFVADFECRRELETLTRKDVAAAFKRVVNFFEASLQGTLEPDVTTPEYGFVCQISNRRALLRQVNFFLTSERVLSDRFETLADNEVGGIRATYHIWDMARFLRQRSSHGHKEPLNINFVELFGHGISCLPANLGSDSYQSFLIVMPATILASLYDRYSARLLEQNVRTFLQARAQVNKGIRATILYEPHMFFAYNNGITATAQNVETKATECGLQITCITDLQIVNGGQTTASLFHTQRRDKADLSNIFVQMKLSVIDSEQGEMIVPRISEYANTQNRVNAADFFSNHPFHIRMAEFARRIWAPAQQGAQRETKWFYERARGQYVDAQAKLKSSEQKRFTAEYPKVQMFTKTDLAKFENVFDDHPKWVNLGSQKNFARYAFRIGKEWESSSDAFNELYFRRAIARGILFRATEKLVSAQPWYNGGYRANIVAYTLSILGEITKRRKTTVNYQRIWATQAIDDVLTSVLAIIAKAVHKDITRPPQGISNISEWCKKDGCWARLAEQADAIANHLPEEFWSGLSSAEDNHFDAKSARKTQKIDNGIEAQRQVFEVPAADWSLILQEGAIRRILTPKEMSILRIAEQMPARIPTEKQSTALINILSKAQQEGIV